LLALFSQHVLHGHGSVEDCLIHGHERPR
jgi:hypothetical protein